MQGETLALRTTRYRGWLAASSRGALWAASRKPELLRVTLPRR